jgi:hypothetical protein
MEGSQNLASVSRLGALLSQSFVVYFNLAIHEDDAEKRLSASSLLAHPLLSRAG